MVPAMANVVETCQRRGLIARFVESISLNNVHIEGMEEKELDFQDCGSIENR